MFGDEAARVGQRQPPETGGAAADRPGVRMSRREHRGLHPGDDPSVDAHLVALIELVLDDRALALEVVFVDAGQRVHDPFGRHLEDAGQRARGRDLVIAGGIDAGVGVVASAESNQPVARRPLRLCVRMVDEVLDDVSQALLVGRVGAGPAAEDGHDGDHPARLAGFDAQAQAAGQHLLVHVEQRKLHLHRGVRQQRRLHRRQVRQRRQRRPVRLRAADVDRRAAHGVASDRGRHRRRRSQSHSIDEPLTIASAPRTPAPMVSPRSPAHQARSPRPAKRGEGQGEGSARASERRLARRPSATACRAARPATRAG